MDTENLFKKDDIIITKNSEWINGGTILIKITNNSGKDINDWSLKLLFKNINLRLDTEGNWVYNFKYQEKFDGNQVGFVYTFSGNTEWNQNIKAGQTIEAGLMFEGNFDKFQWEIYDQSKENERPPTPVGKKVILYFEEWAYHTKEQFGIFDLPFKNMTHLYYAFVLPKPTPRTFQFMTDLKPAHLQDGQGRLKEHFYGIPIFPPTNYDNGKPIGTIMGHDDELFQSNNGFKGLKMLKQSNPNLKIIVSVWGWTLSFNVFEILSNDEYRKNFVESTVDLVIENGLDGVDLDYEFPGEKFGYLEKLYERAKQQNLKEEIEYLEGLNPYDKLGVDQENVRKVFKEIREYMDLKSPNKHLELSAAVNIDERASKIYAGTEKYMDYISLMNYDYVGHDWPGHHQSNLYHNPLFVNQGDQYNTHSSIENLKKNTLFKNENINIGFPTYARLYKVTDINKEQPILSKWVSSSELLPSWSKDYAPNGESGIVSYKDLLEQMNNGNYKYYLDGPSQSPYAYSETEKCIATWTDPQILGNYINKNDYAGIIVWNAADARGTDLLDKITDLITTVEPKPEEPVEPQEPVEPKPEEPVEPKPENGLLELEVINNTDQDIIIKPGQKMWFQLKQ